MNHAATILCALDRNLRSPVELSLFGRAALSLGFENPPAEFGQSLDVDGILWDGQAEALLEKTDFWPAVDATNIELADAGLYISHFFQERQIVLTAGWRTRRLPLKGAWTRLTLFRLGDEDLFLSKLMRFDPQDLADARFIATRAGWTPAQIGAILREARMPDIPEIREQFELCSREFS